VKLKLDEYTE